MSLSWYLNRLRSMSVPEVAHRIREKARKLLARDRMEGWGRYPGSGALPMLPGIAVNPATLSDDIRADILMHADRVAQGTIAALGQAWPSDCLTPGRMDAMWTYDPATGEHWPGAEHYTFDIPYRHRRDLGDIKFVWEFNRLQFLQPLAAAWAISGEERYARHIACVIDSWYENNPPFRGVGWNSGIELALRAISLLIVASLAGNALGKETQYRLRALLRAHAVWIARYPSGFSSANNHLVAEAAAEFLLGIGLDDMPGAAHLRERGLRTLNREAARQILADGAPAEQSPTYGAFTAEFLLLSAYVGAAAGHPLNGATLDRLDAFAAFILAIADAAGNVPSLCDDDEGRVVTDMRHESDYARNIAHILAKTRGLAEPDFGNEPPTRLRTVLFGAVTRSQAHNAGDAASPTEPMARPALATFREGGLSVVHGLTTAGTSYDLLFDHGPLGYLSIAAHGHADALSFTLSVDGIPLFVDPGTFLYHSGGPWRDWFRGTRAHNSLCLNGRDQSIMSGAFNWSHKAHAELIEARIDESDWLLVGEQDGYRRETGLMHRRHIVSTLNGIRIDDHLPGYGKASAELVFQTAPEIQAICAGNVCTLSREGRALARVTLPADGLVACKCGEDGFDGGWFSPSFGARIPAPRLSWNSRAAPPLLSTHIEFLT